MASILTLVRFGVYVWVLYNAYAINLALAVGLGMVFLLIEFIFLLLVHLKRQQDALGFAQSQVINTDFGFTSQQLTEEEAELVDKIREGDLAAAVIFLKGRCQNQLIDFTLLPQPVKLMLAQRLINAINRGESPTWEELLADTKNEKEVPAQ